MSIGEHTQHTRPDDTRTSLRPLMLLARVGAVGFILIVAVLHVISPEIDPISGFVSEYVLGDYPWLMRLAFLSVSLALLAMTLLACRALPPCRRRTVVTGLLSLTTAGTLVAGAFDTDPKSVLTTAPTTSGLIHYWAFMTSVLAFLAAMVALWRIFVRTPGWQEHARPQLVFAAAMLAAFLLMFFSPTEVVGLNERVYLLVALAWPLVASGWFARANQGCHGIDGPGVPRKPHPARPDPRGGSRATMQLVQAELVALDVLHHQARFVLLVRR